MDADHSEGISEFVSITGVDTGRARFYLESAGWDLQIALASFFETGDDEAAPMDGVQDSTSPPNPQAESVPGAAAPAPRPGPNIASFSLKQESSSEDEEGEAFYAGGSERSGQQVLGPPKKKSDDIVSKMFKSAKKHGAELVDLNSGKPKDKPSVFKGTAYRLGATEDDTQVIPSNNPEEPKEPVEITLKMWKNGFSVDNGPIRAYDDPANRDFLQSIRRGEVPRELVAQARGTEVSLTMEDHRNEDFVAPKCSAKPFSGTGHMLGSPMPKVTETSSQQPTNPASGENRDAAAKEEVKVDENKPRTSIQVRLSDGTRLVACLNHSHTVHDLYRYIQIARPQYASANFVLMTTFPNKELQDSASTTIQDANLLNAVVMQRIK